MKKIVVNQKSCIGCGTCTFIASKTFKLGKNGKAEVVSQSGDDEKKIKNAIESCPVNAISAKT